MLEAASFSQLCPHPPDPGPSRPPGGLRHKGETEALGLLGDRQPLNLTAQGLGRSFQNNGQLSGNKTTQEEWAEHERPSVQSRGSTERDHVAPKNRTADRLRAGIPAEPPACPVAR